MKRLWATTLLAALVATWPAWGREVPFLAGRVNDLADLLDEAAESQLEARLAELEETLGVQMVVLTIPSLEGENLEEFSHRVASTWQLGHRGQDNGVLFLVAKNDRKMRLEVGYGLEPLLPDAVCRRILDQIVRPRFRAGQFAAGIQEGVEAVAKVLQKEPLPEPAPSAKGKEAPGLVFYFLFFGIFLLVVGTFSLLALGGSGCQSWFLYLFLVPFWTFFPAVLHPGVGAVTGLGWLLLFPLLKWVLFKTAWGQELRQRHKGLFSAGISHRRRGSGGLGGFFSGGFGGGGFSGGGFSGGGGSFGGGGASSSW
jgi:uncharacterized protein